MHALKIKPERTISQNLKEHITDFRNCDFAYRMERRRIDYDTHN